MVRVGLETSVIIRVGFRDLDVPCGPDAGDITVLSGANVTILVRRRDLARTSTNEWVQAAAADQNQSQRKKSPLWNAGK